MRSGRTCLALFVLAVAPAFAQTAQQSAAASIEHLKKVMDRDHDRYRVYEDADSPGNHFVVYDKMPADGVTTLDASWTATKYAGATSIRCTYDATSPSGWAGWYFFNGTLTGTDPTPSPNRGTVPNAGITALAGATTLTFRARGASGGEQIEFFVAGVGGTYGDSDARRPAAGTRTTLTTSWQQFSIDLTGMSLTYVIGGFGWSADTAHNASGATFYLDDIEYVLNPTQKDARLNEPRFLRSYTTLGVNSGVDQEVRRISFTYDNALAVLAFLAEGSVDSVRRAKLIGDAFLAAMEHDRLFNDDRTCGDVIDPLTVDGARLRSAYASGDIALPPGWTPLGRSGTVPLAGGQNIDAGNNSWAALALLELHQRTSESKYLDAACKLANFVDALRNDSGTYQGFLGGVEDPDGSPSARPWASTEHNLDINAAFSRLFAVTGDARWQSGAAHARVFIEVMWNGNCYYTGTSNPSTRNTSGGQLPLDAQAWAVLSLPNALTTHPTILGCAEAQHKNTHDGFTGFDFNEDRDGVWFEGTAQMTVAYAVAGNTANADTYRAVLRSAQQTATNADGEGIVAASHDSLTTGFGFFYFSRLHTGATSWNVFAQLGVNPYYEPLDAPRHLSASYNGSAGVITWDAVPGATGYEVLRNDGATLATSSPNTTDAAVTPGTAYFYLARATRGGTTPSAYSARELMTAVTFTNDPIAPMATIVRAVHITELRNAVNAVRTLAGLAPATWTDPSLASLVIRAVHLTELRTNLTDARTQLDLSPFAPAYPTLSIVRAIDVSEIREGVR